MNSYSASANPPLRAIILDYGDVISLPADPTVLAWMATEFQVSLEQFRQIYSQFRHDYDSGALSALEYWTAISDATGVKVAPHQIEQLRIADVAMWGRLNERILRWVDELHEAGFKLAVLSNMHQDMIDHIKANGSWTKPFHSLVLSSPLGMAKPQPEIFRYCLNQLGVRAGEALFIDDRQVNVDAAIKVGIAGIVAPSTDALADALESIGFRPVPNP